jgi:hypothetical protein
MHKGRSRITLFIGLALLPIVLSGCPSPHRSTTYTLTIASTPGCTTTPAGALKVEPGVGTSIFATADGGYTFVNWTLTSGTASISGLNPISVTLSSGDATVKPIVTP